MFNGFRSPANLNNFNKPVNPGILATGGTVTQYPANPRTNLAQNPSFATTPSGWTLSPSSGTSGPIQVTGTSISGSTAAMIGNGSNSSMTIGCNIKGLITTPGTYTFSIYVKVYQYGGMTYICGYDYWGDPLYCQSPLTYARAALNTDAASAGTSYIAGPLITTDNNWQRIYVQATFTTIPTLAEFYISLLNMGQGQPIYIDAVLFEKSSSLGTYFDGSMTGYHWNPDGTSSQNTYNIHTFNSSGTFNVAALGTTFNDVDYLVVGGGGSGGNRGGGGGAGGMLSGTMPIGATSYNISVGSGGVGTTSTSLRGSNGQNSSALGLTAIGGGAGGAAAGTLNAENAGASGGSGGGSASPYGYLDGGAGTSGQGNAGGASRGYKDGVLVD